MSRVKRKPGFLLICEIIAFVFPTKYMYVLTPIFQASNDLLWPNIPDLVRNIEDRFSHKAAQILLNSLSTADLHPTETQHQTYSCNNDWSCYRPSGSRCHSTGRLVCT